MPASAVPSEKRHATPASYIALFGHSGSQAPQLMHSSVILIAIYSLSFLYDQETISYVCLWVFRRESIIIYKNSSLYRTPKFLTQIYNKSQVSRIRKPDFDKVSTNSGVCPTRRVHS